MSELLDITQLPECGSCMRVIRASGMSDETVAVASRYLSLTAAEMAMDDEGILTHELTKEEDDKVFNGSIDVKRFFGAVGYCARRIGKDECGTLQYDEVTHQVVVRKMPK